MKARVHVFYKDSVFDPQGATVANSLQQVGFKKVKNVRIGKVIDIDIEGQNEAEAKKDIQKMCETLLSNPVIESYKYEILQGI